MLRPMRETRILMSDGTYDTIRDDWHARTSPNPLTPWVGQTVFFDKGMKRGRLPDQFDLSQDDPALPPWSDEQYDHLQSTEGHEETPTSGPQTRPAKDGPVTDGTAQSTFSAHTHAERLHVCIGSSATLRPRRLLGCSIRPRPTPRSFDVQEITSVRCARHGAGHNHSRPRGLPCPTVRHASTTPWVSEVRA